MASWLSSLFNEVQEIPSAKTEDSHHNAPGGHQTMTGRDNRNLSCQERDHDQSTRRPAENSARYGASGSAGAKSSRNRHAPGKSRDREFVEQDESQRWRRRTSNKDENRNFKRDTSSGEFEGRGRSDNSSRHGRVNKKINDHQNVKHEGQGNKQRRTFKRFPFSADVENDVYRIPYRFKWMISLSEMGGSEVAAQLANSHSGFGEVLKNIQLLKTKPDMLVLIMKLLAKVGYADFKENKIRVLTMACDMDFLDQLTSFMGEVAAKGYQSEAFDSNDFLVDVLFFSKAVLEALPATGVERFKKIALAVEMTVKGMELFQQKPAREDVRQLYETLQLQLFKTEQQNKDKKDKLTSRLELLSAQAPPNNFREISLIPIVDDIFSNKPFVRPNLIRGAYESIEHYLDVQFRLLHEDFLNPMRSGIREYVNNPKSKSITNIRLYNKVLFLSPKVVNDRIGIVLNFDLDKRLKKVNWSHSKRLIYGSLLCFTKDNFRTILFGTIVDRNEKDLSNGIIVVELCGESQINDELFQTQYTMAESEVYFEPYYQVLKALREMNEEDFPMKHYIIDANTESRPPAYLTETTSYAMRPDFNFPVLQNFTWPSAVSLGLDESQYRAFQFALTKEFVVVQGPPGTGKTFLGLKVAGVLLKNRQVWNTNEQPILVVCYTNHALDQFLEGLLRHTHKIVRVGGQSKSDVLNRFNLKELRRELKKRSYETDDELFQTRLHINNNLSLDIQAKLQENVASIKSLQMDLEFIDRKEGILSFESLVKNGVIPDHLQGVFDGNSKKLREQTFVDWLLPQEDYLTENAVLRNAENDNQNESEEEGNEEGLVEDFNEGIVRDAREDFDLNMAEVSGTLRYAESVNQLHQELSSLYMEIGVLETEMRVLEAEMRVLEAEMRDPLRYLENAEQLKLKKQYSGEVRKQYGGVVCKLNVLKRRLKEEEKVMVDMQRLHARNIWYLSCNHRWCLYRLWVAMLRQKLLLNFKEREEKFTKDARQYEEVRQAVDLEIMRDSLIVGMTTSGAARLQSLLKALKPKIVIVEEAAEVLESHIVVSLTSHCQHLILIGDHQQLRPSTSVYKLAKDFNLDVSLFERMLNNNVHCEVLKVQHRMRPEIAALITPSIYPELLNHRDVTLFDEIQGITKNLFFLDHCQYDEQTGDTHSHRNMHEALFMVAFCRHLVLQGYEPSTITILCTYTAQMFLIKTESKKFSLLQNVRITVVDNFQGEESDIILLSLVRSNKDARIGFLKIENRVCVALSRARKGMYIMGNMENLTRSSTIWPKIKETLQVHQAIGTQLQLRCQVHPDQTRLVSQASDFNDILEGGCTLVCGQLLSCGHQCGSVCHTLDREHSAYKCTQPCERILCALNHKCPLLCYQKCEPCKVQVERTLPCGHKLNLPCFVDFETVACNEMVKKVLPACKHEADVPCYKNPAVFPCPISCDARLDDCGHTCRRKCHVLEDPEHLDYKCMQPCSRTNKGCTQNHPCTKKCHEECGMCEAKVWKNLPQCGHRHQMPCHQDPQVFVCLKPCERTMQCGHKCKKKCYEPCGDCAVAVNKILPLCGHKIRLRCCVIPEPHMCRSPCNRKLPCSHQCTALCGEPCITECKEKVRSTVQGACGHQVSLPCFRSNVGFQPDNEELLSYCDAPCGSLLKCEHVCVGTCTQCLQGRVHMSCNEKCGRPQICGHTCDVPCALTCPPCKKQCKLRCYHNKCKKKCGQPCTPCKEPCEWKCEHARCTNRCSELCNRTPCSEPCKKTIKCGHPCIGFCGEPCPPLCRICNEEQVTTVVLGNEDEEDARFVYLEDCKHIVEARDLERWLKVASEDKEQDIEITMPLCPLCKTMITRNKRYSNLIKERYTAVCEVKQRVFGQREEIEHNRKQHLEKLKQISSRKTKDIQGRIKLYVEDAILVESGHFVPMFDKLVETLNVRTKKNTKNVLSNMDTESLGIMTQIMFQLANKAKSVAPHLRDGPRVKMLKQMNMILNVLDSRTRHLSNQEVDDLNLEVQRFHRIADMCVLESTPQFPVLNAVHKASFEQNLQKPLLSISKYSEDLDKRVHQLMDVLSAELKAVNFLTQEERRQIVKAISMRPGHWYKCPNDHYYIITECGGARQDLLSAELKATGIITKEERDQIVKAVGMKPGHWYKCPNGHFYIITECGGAMEVGRCNECGAQIGGSQHRLLASNAHAGEMDGSRYAAWSDLANNLHNWDLRDF